MQTFSAGHDRYRSGSLNDLEMAPWLIDSIARFFLLVTMLSVLFHVRTLSFMYHVDEPYGASPNAGVLSSSRVFSISRSQQKFASLTQSMIPRPHQEKSLLGKRLCPCFHLEPYGPCCSLPRWSSDSPKMIECKKSGQHGVPHHCSSSHLHDDVSGPKTAALDTIIAYLKKQT